MVCLTRRAIVICALAISALAQGVNYEQGNQTSQDPVGADDANNVEVEINGGLRDKIGNVIPGRTHRYELYSLCQDSKEYSSFQKLNENCNAKILKLNSNVPKKMYSDLKFKVNSKCDHDASSYTDISKWEEDCEVDVEVVKESIPKEFTDKNMYRFALHSNCKDADSYEDYQKFDEECSFKIKEFKKRISNNYDNEYQGNANLDFGSFGIPETFGGASGLGFLTPGSGVRGLVATSPYKCGNPNDYNNVQEYLDVCIPDGFIHLDLSLSRV